MDIYMGPFCDPKFRQMVRSPAAVAFWIKKHDPLACSMKKWFQSKWVQWLAYFVGWTLFAIFLVTQDAAQCHFQNRHIDWNEIFAGWFTEAYLWALLAPLVWFLAKHWPLDSRAWRANVFAHIFFSVLVAILEATLFSLIFFYCVHKPKATFAATLWYVLPVDFHFNLAIYWGITVVQYSTSMYRKYQEQQLRASELQRQLIQSRLGALRAQLHPHFLFNTLNAIVVLIRQHKTTEADEMLTNLSQLLRQTLEDWEIQEVPLHKEIEFLKLYLDIEQVRFQDRLKIEMELAPETLDSLVPCFLLQPLVENAIRHGIAKSSSAGSLTLTSRLVDSMLEIQVCDDGPGFSDGEMQSSKGMGLKNTRARLRELYGDEQSLRLENSSQGGTVATVTIACHQEAYAEL